MRHGKPIKNKRHVDPRYFLNEGADLIKKVCTHKEAIVKAIKNGQISNAVAMGRTLGLLSEEVAELHDAILSLTGHETIDQMLEGWESKELAINAIQKGCQFASVLPF